LFVAVTDFEVVEYVCSAEEWWNIFCLGEGYSGFEGFFS